MAFIYEHIRTKGYSPLHLEEHYARMTALSEELFCAPFDCSSEKLAERIGEALRMGGCSPRTENAVCVRRYDSGEIVVEAVEMIYNSFSLRALRPEGYICRVSGELLTKNTSAKEAMLELNRTTAQIADKGVAIWTNDSGEVVAIDGAAVIAVFEDEIRFSQCGSGVEFELARKELKSRSRKVTTAPIQIEELPKIKELLGIDYRGVTAIEGYGAHHYMDITAEKIAHLVATAEKG
ncbi:MAG: hypothetical protein J6C94_06910 [Alistipes sp.]|nr:hypothetical protein [Alistipes sp.]